MLTSQVLGCDQVVYSIQERSWLKDMERTQIYPKVISVKNETYLQSA